MTSALWMTKPDAKLTRNSPMREASRALFCPAGACLLRPAADGRIPHAGLLRAGPGLLSAAGLDHQHSAALTRARHSRR